MCSTCAPAVLREIKETLGDEALHTLLDNVGKRTAERIRSRLDIADPKRKAEELAAILRENGVEADVVETPLGALELREHNCPYARTVSEYPEVCSIIHTVLHETVSDGTRQIESLATGGAACRFEIEQQQETASGSRLS